MHHGLRIAEFGCFREDAVKLFVVVVVVFFRSPCSFDRL